MDLAKTEKLKMEIEHTVLAAANLIKTSQCFLLLEANVTAVIAVILDVLAAR